MATDFYFDGILGIKTKEPLEHIYQNKHKLKELVKLLKLHPEPFTRQPHEFKELRQLLERFPWFRENIFGISFNNVDANELFKHVKIKHYPANSVVYLPGDMDRSLFFILRGRVVMGVEHARDIDDGTKIFKLTHAASKLGILSRS